MDEPTFITQTMSSRERLRENFITESMKHENAINVGNHRKANSAHKELHKLYHLANEQGHADVFSEMLNFDNENVRLWAAIFTLRLVPDVAEETLKSLSQSSSIVGLEAGMTLLLWKEGKLDLI